MSATKNSEITLTVGEERVGTDDVTKGEKIDVIDRDPTLMNQHLKVLFHDIIAEPDPTIFSFDKIWVLSYKVFTNSKLWCYRITTLILAIPASLLWGINFACISFCHIWCCIPCVKAYDTELLCIAKTWTICLNTFYRPCYEAVGYMFYNIRVRIIKGDESTA